MDIALKDKGRVISYKEIEKYILNYRMYFERKKFIVWQYGQKTV